MVQLLLIRNIRKHRSAHPFTSWGRTNMYRRHIPKILHTVPLRNRLSRHPPRDDHPQSSKTLPHLLLKRIRRISAHKIHNLLQLLSSRKIIQTYLPAALINTDRPPDPDTNFRNLIKIQISLSITLFNLSGRIRKSPPAYS